MIFVSGVPKGEGGVTQRFVYRSVIGLWLSFVEQDGYMVGWVSIGLDDGVFSVPESVLCPYYFRFYGRLFVRDVTMGELCRIYH